MALNVDIDVEVSKDASSAIQRAQRKRMMDGADKGFAVSQSHVPEDRGTLRQSGFKPVFQNGSVVWGYRANHALPIEEGTEPFHPPTKPLVEWSKRVTGDPGLGYYVANVKIPEEGIDAQPFASPGAEAQKQWYKNNSFGDYLEKEL